jgi:hypothetical protein
VTLKCRENLRWRALSRLATVRQLAVSTFALVLGAAAAIALVSCGGGEDAKLLPGNTAQEITENLDRVKQYAEEGECVGAEDAAGEVNAQVESLSGVDPKLVAALERGAGRLSEVIATCEEEPLETTESTEATTTERSLPPGQEKKEEKEREKEAAKLEKEAEHQEKHEETPPVETTPEETATPPEPPAPSEGGGTGAPGGVSPGAPAAPGAG